MSKKNNYSVLIMADKEQVNVLVEKLLKENFSKEKIFVTAKVASLSPQNFNPNLASEKSIVKFIERYKVDIAIIDSSIYSEAIEYLQKQPIIVIGVSGKVMIRSIVKSILTINNISQFRYSFCVDQTDMRIVKLLFKFPVRIMPDNISSLRPVTICDDRASYLKEMNKLSLPAKITSEDNRHKPILVEEYIAGEQIIITTYIDQENGQIIEAFPSIFNNDILEVIQQTIISPLVRAFKEYKLYCLGFIKIYITLSQGSYFVTDITPVFNNEEYQAILTRYPLLDIINGVLEISSEKQEQEILI